MTPRLLSVQVAGSESKLKFESPTRRAEGRSRSESRVHLGHCETRDSDCQCQFDTLSLLASELDCDRRRSLGRPSLGEPGRLEKKGLNITPPGRPRDQETTLANRYACPSGTGKDIELDSDAVGGHRDCSNPTLTAGCVCIGGALASVV